ncbi:Disease resistance protein RPM1 [Linum grandiflorum]
MAGLPVDCFAHKLDSLFQNEVTLFEQARHQVEDIKHELASMRSFLEDSSNSNATHSKLRQTQIAHVRDLVYDVEDTIDQFIYHRSKWWSSSRHNLTGYLRTTLCFPLFFWERRQIATKLGEIDSLIKAIPERYRRYQLEDNNNQASTANKGECAPTSDSESALFLKEEELVGIEASKKTITRWLTGGDSRLTTVSVVGMGGSGKTTLVANVFKSPAVKRCFDCCTWITVPRSFVIEDLLRSLIRELNKSAPVVGGLTIDELNRMEYRDLVENLMNHLERKKYLIVLDDVWNASVWSRIKVSLPDGQNGNRIILTTRMEDIALYSGGSYIFHVKPLEKNKSWELFCRRAFSRQCPPQLHDLAADIVEKCQGLPLAIVSMGGLFSTKRCSVAEWTRVRDNLQWELSNNQILEPIKSILLLSYYDLPYRLKYCFLYCCMFPQDYKIWCGRLTRLWMAEGFVEVEVDGITPEEVASRYLNELIHRNMLQSVDSQLSVNDRMCKMHDMYREVGLMIAKQDKFFYICDAGRSPAAVNCEEENHHRLSVHQASNNNAGDIIKVVEGMPRIRSLFVASINGCTPFSLGALNGTRLRLLRVLDLEDAPVEELPHHMENLFNLRFLNLFGTQVKRLPSSIGKLQNLQTLDILSTKVATLPKEIMKLQKLRHLATGYVKRTASKEYNVMYGICVLSGSDISCLKNLQSLRLVEASKDLIKQLGHMTQLVVLGITNVKGKSQMDDLCRSIKKMPCLQQLSIAAGNEDEILEFDELGQSPPLPCLQYLSLYGKLDKFPNWVSSLPSLIDLQMHWSRLPKEEDPLQHLHRLQSLSNIVLNNAYQGTELNFARGFDNLRTMELKDFAKLESIFMAEGTMPGINMLQISSCMNLKTAAQGIQHLSELVELRLEYVSAELVEQIRGPDRLSFLHIPLVRCHYYSSTRQQYVSENIF